jgi:hypothetical protein
MKHREKKTANKTKPNKLELGTSQKKSEEIIAEHFKKLIKTVCPQT